MSKRSLLSLFFIGLMAAALSAAFQRAPGYMDADYYYAGGLQLARGEGFYEPFLWNYLDDPAGLPHPSHTYWMPLASILAAGGMAITGSLSFYAAQWPFVLLSALVAPLTAVLAFRIHKNTPQARLAGILAALPAFYLPLMTTTETFSLYMLLGGMFLLLATKEYDPFTERNWPLQQAFLLGLIAGLLHLSRADGLLWLAAALLVVVWRLAARQQKITLQLFIQSIPTVLLVLAGYAVPMGIWYVRNFQLYSWILPPAGSKAIWITEYNQLYSFPADGLSFENWARTPVVEHLQARFWALGMNLKNFAGVQMQIYLLPLVLAGLYRYRKNALVQLGASLWLVTLGVMTLVFPLAGARGGFLHSSAALQPLFWAAAPVGLQMFVDVGKKYRSWKPKQAFSVFSTGAVLFSAVLTIGLYVQRVIGPDWQETQWEQSWRDYRSVEESLRAIGAEPDDRILTNNPPGYFAANRRPAIVIPDGDIGVAIQAMEQYQVAYLLLEKDQENLHELFEDPGDAGSLKYVQTVEGMHVFVLEQGLTSWKP